MSSEPIKRTFFVAYAATGISQVCEVLYSYLLYDAFSVGDLGLFAWASAIVVFFSMSIDLGLEPILTRRLSRDSVPARTAYAAALALRLPLVFIAAGLLFAGYWFGLFTGSETLMLCLLGGASVFNIADGVSRAWFRAHKKQDFANAVIASTAALKLLVIVVLLTITGADIVALALGLLAARALISIAALALVFRTSQCTAGSTSVSSAALSGEMLRSGVMLGAISLLTAAQNRLDWLLVSHFGSREALVSYALGTKFYEIAQVVVGAALMTIYPWLCRTDSDPLRISILLRLTVWLGMAIGFGGIVLGVPVVELLFGQKFSDARMILPVFMCAAGYVAIAGVIYQLLLSKGSEWTLLLITLACTAVQATVNLILIPELGLLGGAVSKVILVCMTAVSYAIVASRRGLLAVTTIIRLAFGSLVFGATAVFLIVGADVLGLGIALVVACFAIVGSFGVFFGRPDRRFLQEQVLLVLRPSR